MKKDLEFYETEEFSGDPEFEYFAERNEAKGVVLEHPYSLDRRCKMKTKTRRRMSGGNGFTGHSNIAWEPPLRWGRQLC